MADSAFIDRLADRVYDIDRFENVTLFPEPDGSVSVSLDIDAPDPMTATDEAARLFFTAFVEAQPLRLPELDELEAAHRAATQAAAEFQAGFSADELTRHLLAGFSAQAPREREDGAVPA